MKVKLEENYKKYYTIEELEQAKAVISYEKDDESTVESWAEYAAREATKNMDIFPERIIEATAHTARNARIWNAYGENTGNIDVAIEGIAESYNAIIKFTAYLSDIWQTGAVDYNERIFLQVFRLER